MKNTLLAPPVTSNIDKKSEEFAKYKSAMLEKLDGIEDLLDFVELGGGMHHHERLAARGKCLLEIELLILLTLIHPF